MITVAMPTILSGVEKYFADPNRFTILVDRYLEQDRTARGE